MDHSENSVLSSCSGANEKARIIPSGLGDSKVIISQPCMRRIFFEGDSARISARKACPGVAFLVARPAVRLASSGRRCLAIRPLDVAGEGRVLRFFRRIRFNRPCKRSSVWMLFLLLRDEETAISAYTTSWFMVCVRYAVAAMIPLWLSVHWKFRVTLDVSADGPRAPLAFSLLARVASSR